MELRGDSVWDGGTVFAELEPVGPDTEGVVRLRTLVPAVMDRDLARRLVVALAPVEGAVAWSDDLTRSEARRAGWTGALRAALRPSTGPAPAAGADLVPEVEALLEGLAVTRRASRRRVMTLRVNDGTGRRVLRVKIPDRADAMPEVVARAIDT